MLIAYRYYFTVNDGHFLDSFTYSVPMISFGQTVRVFSCTLPERKNWG
jgi:hypothetical protein